MTTPFRLRAEDRPDFEAVLHLALNTPDVRSVLTADPSGRTAARLRMRALTDADEIAAAAREEYDDYIALRAAAQEEAPAEGSVLPAVAVLTPLVAATSAAVLLTLGYTVQLTDVRPQLSGPLITAGWTLTLLAAAGTLAALTALLTTALRRRPNSTPPALLEQARATWQQSLLTHGMLPHLRRYAVPEQTARPPAKDQNQ
ncbi:hypothetical protein ABZ896_15825 [Streptomyces sp. NPDC047072]|uniref:hypothetical protein n=1 Tax=Streptomyces sp. NPDC047072 TaxID=3154809 RepID=UPI00340CFE0F